MPASLVPLCRPPSTLTDVDDFLRSQDRSAYNMLPDGNCMFRALSHQLFGTVEHHLELRQTLLSVIQNNYATYEPYWIEHTPHGIVKFKDHMKSLANPGSWGTHVELQATSDCFNVTVFICSPNLSRILRWERKAVPRYHSAIKLPALHITPMLPFSSSNHIELFYSFFHYQSVIPMMKGTKLILPAIIARKSDHVVCITD